MTKEELKNYIDIGHEIEFKYKGKMYSITYGDADGVDVISFCEFYKEPIDVINFDDLCKINYQGENLLDILASLNDKQDVWIF